MALAWPPARQRPLCPTNTRSHALTSRQLSSSRRRAARRAQASGSSRSCDESAAADSEPAQAGAAARVSGRVEMYCWRRGFGFLRVEGAGSASLEVFVSYVDLITADGSEGRDGERCKQAAGGARAPRAALWDGQTVEFSLEAGAQRPRARRVTAAGGAPLPLPASEARLAEAIAAHLQPEGADWPPVGEFSKELSTQQWARILAAVGAGGNRDAAGAAARVTLLAERLTQTQQCLPPTLLAAAMVACSQRAGCGAPDQAAALFARCEELCGRPPTRHVLLSAVRACRGSESALDQIVAAARACAALDTVADAARHEWYSLLARAYFGAGAFRKAQFTCERLWRCDSASAAADTSLLGLSMVACCRSGQADKAIAIYEDARDEHTYLPIGVHAAAATAYAKEAHGDEVRAAVELCFADGAPPTNRVLRILAKAVMILAESARDGAEEAEAGECTATLARLTLGVAKHDGITRSACIEVARACAFAGLLDAAIALLDADMAGEDGAPAEEDEPPLSDSEDDGDGWLSNDSDEDMHLDGSSGAVREWNSVLTAVASRGRPRWAMALLETLESHESVSPDTVSYNIALGLASRDGDMALSQQLLDQMAARAVQPDEATLVALFGCYGAAGRADLAPQALVRALNSGVALRTAAPFNAALSAAGHSGDASVAKAVMSLLLDENERAAHEAHPDRTTFLAAIECAGRAGELEYADELLSLAEDARLAVPETYAKVLLVHTIIDRTKPEVVETILQRMASMGVQPNEGTLKTAVLCLARARDLEGVLVLKERFEAMGVGLTGVAYTALFRVVLHGGARWGDRAVQLVEEMHTKHAAPVRGATFDKILAVAKVGNADSRVLFRCSTAATMALTDADACWSPVETAMWRRLANGLEVAAGERATQESEAKALKLAEDIRSAAAAAAEDDTLDLYPMENEDLYPMENEDLYQISDL